MCAVRAFDAWVTASGMTTGALFRRVDRNGRLRLSDRAVARCVSGRRDAGRAPGGEVRGALAPRQSFDAIMRQTHHKSERVVRGYIRHAGGL